MIKDIIQKNKDVKCNDNTEQEPIKQIIILEVNVNTLYDKTSHNTTSSRR